jgi:putative DNA primase/helicase
LATVFLALIWIDVGIGTAAKSPCWQADLTGEVERLTKETIQALYSESSELPDVAARTELAKHAVKSEAEARIRAMIELAKTEPGMPVTPDQLDTDPWLLNCANGTLDLRTGRLLPFDRAKLCTKQVPVDFDPDAECPTWESFLDHIMSKSAGLISFLQRAIGYSLTGKTIEEVLFFLYGTGANGKTTFVETSRTLLADYARQADFNSFLETRNDGARNDLARLRGARFVAAVEAGEGRKLAETIVKQATGGDKITARFLYHESFEYTPQFKLFLVANHKPNIAGTDEAIWRRMRLIPFNVTIPPAKRDKNLQEKLRAELPGILAWAVRGCLDWQKNGLGSPVQVEQATADYRREMDTLADFLEDRCIINPKDHVLAASLYGNFKLWCDSNGEQPMTQKAFGIKLRERGFRRGKFRGERCWIGVRLPRASDG